ncbi:hypothetical protein D3C81_1425220 [compost metagenome]
MSISKIHELFMAAAEMAAQLLMVMVAVVPAPVVQYQRRKNDPRHFPTDGLLKPVLRVTEEQVFHIRRHKSAPARQTVKLPESALIFGAIAVRIGIHGGFGRHKIAAKEIG